MSFGPIQSASAPRSLRSSIIVSTSTIRGTLWSWTGSAVSRQAARIGRAPFLFLAARMRPWSGLPPSMTKLSAARPMTAVWAIAVAYPGRGNDTRTRLGDPDQVHAERGPAAPCACGRGLARVVRQALRRRRGALAGRRAPARFRLRDPSDPRPAPSGRSADPERRGLSGGSDRGGALPRGASRDAPRHAPEEGAVRLRRAVRLRARLRARATGRHRRARAEVGEEEAEAAVVCRRGPSR